MTRQRPAAELLWGDGGRVVEEIHRDFSLLEAGAQAARVWLCETPTVVLGVGRDLEAEVRREECQRRGVAMVRRASGGGTVLVGPGTVQYAMVIPHEAGVEPPAIDLVKARCNELLREALAHGGVTVKLDYDASGDLRVLDRKVGGVALRRHRAATLLHGTLLCCADLELVAAVLAHPAREPAWRRGRSHGDFLCNLGAIDIEAFARRIGGTRRGL